MRASLGHSVRVPESRASTADSRATTHAQRLSGRDGYFAPESVIRRLGNTPLVPFLGGGPAVLLQVAHPLVAAGVLDHSDVRRDLWRRLVHTLRALYLIAYGTKEEADRAAKVVRAVHAHVHGSTRTQLGRFPPGMPYSAFDPELMLWVHATLVQASLAAYERFVHPLSGEDQERYYQEMALVARLFGTPASVIPRSLADFRDYFAAQISGETIAVTAPAKEVAAVILAAQLPAPLRMFVPAHRLSTAALLPPRLRIRALLGSTEAVIDLGAPVDPDRDHIRGPAGAPVTIVEYGDFECPYCGQAEAAVRELLAGHGDVRYVWRHLPLNDVHPHAQLAAEAAEAAAGQGKFWQMHDQLLDHQGALTGKDLIRYAGELGLDTGRFTRDDVELLEAFHRAELAGLTRDRFPVEGVGSYVELLGELARREVRRFTRQLHTYDESELLEIAERALQVTEPIVTLIRRKLILRALRAELAGSKGSKKEVA